ncbi:hypothetical protein ABE137_10305 [Brevibacillus laterosporus]|uniref:hypothetical protein n=1 Tax=Brevibacillus laterosporus TaxID=1465 RepID=UPI003D1E0C11
MIKQPINIRLDYGEVVSGYLVEGLLAMYVSDGYLYLVRVREQNGKYQQDSGHLILGQVEDGWSLIPVIFAKLQNMSAWELITQYLNWNVIDSSLDIVY